MSNTAKRPPLTTLLREQAKPALTPEEQQRIQAENDRKLYGTRSSEFLPSALVTNAASEPSRGGEEPPAAPDSPVPVGDRWIPFGSYIHDQVYLHLKQAEFWEPGFEIRKFVNNALRAALQELPSAQRALPAEQLEAVRKKTSKTSK